MSMTTITAPAVNSLVLGQQHRKKEPDGLAVTSCEVCGCSEPRLATSWLAKT